MKHHKTGNRLALAILVSVTLYTPLSWAAPRSDARILHVDFENYVDGIVQPLNAGIRWLGDPFSSRDEGAVDVTDGFGFGGSRSGHIYSERLEQISRIRLQHRFDAPQISDDEVIEMVFRVSRSEPVDLDDLLVCSIRSKDGKAVGIEILANGKADTGRYRLGVKNDEGSTKTILGDLDQAKWIRIIQHRRRSQGVVDIWGGLPQEEVLLGTFPDPGSKAVSYSMELGDGSTATCRGSGYWDDIRIGGELQADAPVADPEPPLRDVSQEVAQQQLPIPVGSTKQLFIDDAVIESSSGLTRTLHPVKKHPANPLIVPEHPWEGMSVLLYGAVIRDPMTQKLRMWYLAWGKQIGQPSYICYAESDDGIRWSKPNLGLIEHDGSKENNILMPGWSQTTVLYDPTDEDPARRGYKAVLRLNGTRGFFSPDGIHWEDKGVIIDQAYDGTSVHWDPVDRKWIAMVKIFRDGKRARGYGESADFLNWTDTYFMMTVDEQDRPGDQLYSQYMFHYESAYFGLLRMYHTDSDIVDIQLTTSRNAKHWDRSIRDPFIPTSPEEGTWDFANNAVPSTPPIRVGDELWFYYSGRSVLHNVSPNDGAIGLGTLRVDGFISMDADDSKGVLTTKPMRLTGDTLCVNADASSGNIQIEILDDNENVIGDYSATNCHTIESDEIRHAVYWDGNASLDNLGNRDVQLRFSMENAKLYSFWTE